MKDLILKAVEKNNFLNYIGFKTEHIEHGLFEGVLILEPHHMQQYGAAHGGLVATLCDLTAGFAAYTLHVGERKCVTAEIKVSYLNPAIGDYLVAKGKVLKSGKMLCFCESEVWAKKADQADLVLVAKATATIAWLDINAFK